MSRRVVAHPWVVIALFALFTALMGSQLGRLQVDPETKSMLPPDMPALEDLERIQAVFGGSESLVVVLQAPDVLAPAVLEQLAQIEAGLSALPGVERTYSPLSVPAIVRENGRVAVRAPDPTADRATLEAALRTNDLVLGNVLAPDLRAAAVVAVLGFTAVEGDCVAAARALTARVPGPATTQVGGMPAIRTAVGEDILGDMSRFLPIGFGIILVFLYACFRSWRGVVLPLVIVAMSVVVAMGLIPVFGWKVQLVSNMLPVILFAVANDYGIHLLARAQEPDLAGLPSKEAALRVTQDLGMPVIAAGLTTMLGLLCLQTHTIVPAAQLGVLAAAGVGFALLASISFLPALLAVLPPTPPATRAEQGSGLDRWLDHTARAVCTYPRTTLLAAGSVMLLGSAGLPWLSIDSNVVNYYPSDSPVVQTARTVNDHFGGATELLVQFDHLDRPDTLARIATLEQRLRAHEYVGYVGSVLSITRAINAGAPGAPSDSDALAYLQLLHELGSLPPSLDRLVDFDGQHALLIARINTLSTSQITQVVRAAEAEIGDRDDVVISGGGPLYAEVIAALVRGQFLSLGLALLVVFLVVAGIFRSFEAAAYALLPLSLAIPMLFGLMGTLGIELNAATSLLSSVMIGIGVDYSVHFLWRYRQEVRAGVAPVEAVRITLTTTGRGIVFNGLSVVFGFSALLLSNFLPVRFFGFLISVSITTCLLGALLVLPALLLLTRPRFLARG